MYFGQTWRLAALNRARFANWMKASHLSLESLPESHCAHLAHSSAISKCSSQADVPFVPKNVCSNPPILCHLDVVYLHPDSERKWGPSRPRQPPHGWLNLQDWTQQRITSKSFYNAKNQLDISNIRCTITSLRSSNCVLAKQYVQRPISKSNLRINL